MSNISVCYFQKDSCEGTCVFLECEDGISRLSFILSKEEEDSDEYSE